MISQRTKQEEIDINFDFFQKELPRLLGSNLGKYALIRDSKITGFYDTIGDAHTSGSQLFSDGLCQRKVEMSPVWAK